MDRDLSKKSGRGRPPKSADERDAARGRIVKTARRLFEAEGYATISIRRLAREAGCAPMTIYQHFDAKIDVLRALWDDVFALVIARMEAAAAAEADPAARLSAVGAAYASYWLENPEHYRLVFMTEGVEQSEVGAFIANPRVGRGFELIAEAIAALHPGQSQEKLALRADLFLCLLQGLAHNHITISGYPWSAAEPVIADLVDLWRRES